MVSLLLLHPPFPFVVLHIIPVLIRCQQWGLHMASLLLLPPSPFVVLHIIPVLIRCQTVGFTYGIPPSPPSLPLVVLHIIPVLIRCQAVGLHMASLLLLPLPICGTSYNTCPHQIPGSWIYIWHPSFSSLPPPLGYFI